MAMQRSVAVGAQGGSWRTVYDAKVLGIHAALLHTGKVLFFSYQTKKNEDQPSKDHVHGRGSAAPDGAYELLDIASWKGEALPLERNLFCGGHSFLPDGQLLVIGGQYRTHLSLFDPPSHDVHLFDPEARSHDQRWKRLPSMDSSRWYPTCVTLHDGRVLVMGGLNSFIGIYGPMNNTWQVFDSAKLALSRSVHLPFEIRPYPFMHLLPDGHVFVHSEVTTRLLDPTTGRWKTEAGSSHPLEFETDYAFSRTNPGQGSSILLPLRPDTDPPYRARVMLIGGAGSNKPNLKTPATATAEVFDFGADKPRWRYTRPMHYPRVMPDTILLPDGKVLVVSGSSKGRSDQAVNPVYEPEVFDPESETWTRLAPMTVERLYHSTALLLPTAEVLVAGNDAEWNKEPYNRDEHRVEVFAPPYGTSAAPEIGGVPSTASYGETFTVETPRARDIASAALLRLGSVTHSNNMDQRYVGLSVVSRTGDSLGVQTPPTPMVAPPGWYMLFLVNTDGVPSLGRFLRL